VTDWYIFVKLLDSGRVMTFNQTASEIKEAIDLTIAEASKVWGMHEFKVIEAGRM
jgi:hypothetical protein